MELNRLFTSAPAILLVAAAFGATSSADASQPPASALGGVKVTTAQLESSNRALSTCNRNVMLSVNDRSMVGWVGDEMVSMVKRGMQFFGTHQSQPLRLKMVGSQDRGYRVRGMVAGEEVDWKIDGDTVSAELHHCIE